MAFSFGTPKTTSGFALPTTSAPAASAAPTFQFSARSASGDASNAPKPLFGVATPKSTAAASTPSFGGFGFGTSAPSSTTQPALNLSTSATSAAPSFLTPPTTTTSVSVGTTFLTPNTAATTTTTTTTTATSASTFGVTLSTAATTAVATAAATTSTPPVFSGFPVASTPSTSVQFSLGGTPTLASVSTATSSTTSATSTQATPTTQSVVSQTGTLTFAQLEDAINRWTIQLEDQSKIFFNQAKQLNAWDCLLITNGEKIVNINRGLQEIRQQQQQLDHELDFILSQQKELEDLIEPLEKELADVPIHDHDRYAIYQMAESLDSQLKQQSDDLKEAIEYINEAGRGQAADDPISQIAKILNAHMNSLQWIDRNTAQINSHLNQISKMQEQVRYFRTS